MKRREFITLLGGAIVVPWPRAAMAQGPKQVPRIGVLMELAETDSQARSNVAALQRGLRRLGRIDGRNLELKYRWTSHDPVLLWRFAKELVELRPDVIITHSTPGVSTLLGQTRRNPSYSCRYPTPPVRASLKVLHAREAMSPALPISSHR